MSTLDSDSSPDLATARFAVFALQASATRDASGAEYASFAFNGVRMNDVGAMAQQLMKQQKPVECSASATDGVLAIACRSVERTVRFDGTRAIRVIKDNYGSDGVVLHARSRHGSVLLLLESYERFYSDYFLFALATSVQDPDEECRRLGAHAVLRVGSYAPDAIRTVME